MLAQAPLDILPERVPRHIAVIMDGNGRWAKARGLSRTQGHKEGAQAARRMVEDALNAGVQHLTLYAFSQENWKRPQSEVGFLFDLLISFIDTELASLEKRGVQLRLLGSLQKIPFPAKKALEYAVQRTKNNGKMVLNLAINYSGRQEIVDACNAFIAANPTTPLTVESLAELLYTKGQPDPDLVIRTSGEQRLSNFLPFQTTYSEFYFTDTLWPDFSRTDFYQALHHFSQRSRRFGALDEK